MEEEIPDTRAGMSPRQHIGHRLVKLLGHHHLPGKKERHD